jgi:hypothetical protein
MNGDVVIVDGWKHNGGAETPQTAAASKGQEWGSPFHFVCQRNYLNK